LTEHAYEYTSVATQAVDVAWDERFLAALRASDWAALRSLDIDESLDNAGGGAHEVRSWLAALAAGLPGRGQSDHRSISDSAS
jgi:hypothetical protein